MSAKRPHTSIGHRRQCVSKADYRNVKSGVAEIYTPPRTALSRHPRVYQHVETFNLNPGYRVSKSANKLYVRINTPQFFDPPKPEPPERKLTVEQMETIVCNLKEQIGVLNTFLEEERLRHKGTQKRCGIERQKMIDELRDKHQDEIQTLYLKNEKEKDEIEAQHDATVRDMQREAQERYHHMQTEYNLLQASFKNFRNELREEMNEKWKLKLEEFEWQKQRDIENAVDENRRNMESRMSIEKAELKKEFLAGIDEMRLEHRHELDALERKFAGGNARLAELQQRSDDLDRALAELAAAKNDLDAERSEAKRARFELKETTTRLNTLETELESRVQAVEDQHRHKIEQLMLGQADARMLMARSREELTTERMARDRMEDERRDTAKRGMEERLAHAARMFQTFRRSPAHASSADDDGDSSTRGAFQVFREPVVCTCAHSGSAGRREAISTDEPFDKGERDEFWRRLSTGKAPEIHERCDVLSSTTGSTLYNRQLLPTKVVDVRMDGCVTDRHRGAADRRPNFIIDPANIDSTLAAPALVRPPRNTPTKDKPATTATDKPATPAKDSQDTPAKDSRETPTRTTMDEDPGTNDDEKCEGE